jgi:hypothetical protein
MYSPHEDSNRRPFLLVAQCLNRNTACNQTQLLLYIICKQWDGDQRHGECRVSSYDCNRPSFTAVMQMWTEGRIIGRDCTVRPERGELQILTRTAILYRLTVLLIVSRMAVNCRDIQNSSNNRGRKPWSKYLLVQKITRNKLVKILWENTPPYVAWEILKRKKKKLHGLSPRANYTDRATAACRRSDCQLLRKQFKYLRGAKKEISKGLSISWSILAPPLWSSGQSSWLQNGDVSCFLWGTKWIYICYVEESRPPLWYSGQSSWLHNGDVLCLLWGTNWIYICYVEGSRPPLWSSGQSSWLHNADVLCLLWGTNWTVSTATSSQYLAVNCEPIV